MARNVFFSFHFKNDFWRTQQVRNIGTLEPTLVGRVFETVDLETAGDTFHTGSGDEEIARVGVV
ncbi:TIR domain-containing protein [Pseudomonas gingeri]|uniref:TIR domain-containing protein n=1 Tax=Pseudomonas gingeri TaxID=117681 RepID=UPI00210B7B35|nr:TIR domain-containing protein [Pseudomonas gingeri]